jgi:hypothetical protein
MNQDTEMVMLRAENEALKIELAKARSEESRIFDVLEKKEAMLAERDGQLATLVRALRYVTTVHDDEAEFARAMAQDTLSNLPAAAKELLERVEKAEQELSQWRRSFSGHVYVKNEDYAAKVERAEAAEARVKELEKANKEAEQQFLAEMAARTKAEAALAKINDIRNSIVGTQKINWSEHAYPLVAALDEAGVEGMPYPEGREYFGTLIERTNKAEKERDDAQAEAAALRKALFLLMPYAESRIEDIAECTDDGVSTEEHRVALEYARAVFDGARAALERTKA